LRHRYFTYYIFYLFKYSVIKLQGSDFMVKAGKPYGNMIIRMDMDTAQFTQSLTAIRRGSRNLRDEMKAVNNVFRGSGNEAKRLGEEFKVLERIMKQQEKEYQSLANRKRELEKQNKTETVQYTNIVQQMNRDRKSTRLNSSHVSISYAVFCLKKKI